MTRILVQKMQEKIRKSDFIMESKRIFTFVTVIFSLIICQSVSAQWFWQNPLPQGNSLTAISFSNANNGAAVGNTGTILTTTDGGNSWGIQISGTTKHLYGVSFYDENNGITVGNDGTILRTTDGGSNWLSQVSGTLDDLRGISFTSENNGTAVGKNGTILRTTDGGASWVNQPSGTINDLFGFIL